jgi:O-methyltransferase
MKILNFEIKKINKYKNSIAEINPYELKLINKCLGYSMTNLHRMWSLVQSFHYIRQKKISGEFVECGVWKGGNLILLKTLLQKYNLNKKVYGFDTFEGMPKPSSVDVKYNGKSGLTTYYEHKKLNLGFAYSEIAEVENNLRENCSLTNIKLIKGRVEETLLVRKNLPKKISILRLDTDFYSSTKVELNILYPRLVTGGVLIIDDYGFWKGARKAVDEYFKNFRPFFHYVDHSCRLMIKS